MNKTELRHQYLKKRLSLDRDDVEFMSELICRQFFALDAVNEKQYFHIFLPIAHNKEINTWPIIKNLWSKKKRVITPVSDFVNFQMTNYYIDTHTHLKENKYGIPEPVGAKVAKSKYIDVVILPLLAFDVLGYRVGYGKGFYDKFINCLPQPVVKIGLSFFQPVETIEDLGEWDEKLDYCITPEKIYSFL